jgi:hypothetical protein
MKPDTLVLLVWTFAGLWIVTLAVVLYYFAKVKSAHAKITRLRARWEARRHQIHAEIKEKADHATPDELADAVEHSFDAWFDGDR